MVHKIKFCNCLLHSFLKIVITIWCKPLGYIAHTTLTCKTIHTYLKQYTCHMTLACHHSWHIFLQQRLMQRSAFFSRFACVTLCPLAQQGILNFSSKCLWIFAGAFMKSLMGVKLVEILGWKQAKLTCAIQAEFHLHVQVIKEQS